MRAIAPHAAARGAARPRHVVQFFQDDDFLVDATARFVGTALAAGGTTIVIATGPHRAGVETQLGTRGIDVATAGRHGRYVALDAEEMLARVMTAQGPDEARFMALVGACVDRAARREGGRVHAFGEMVALLWARGDREAAIRLEALWNQLTARVRFSLLCAYPMTAFARRGDEDDFLRVCASHSHVRPAESWAPRTSRDVRLRTIARLQQKALALETETVERRRAEESAGRARAEAEAASCARDEFLSVVSHELRTPLAAMLGWVSVLKRAPPGELAARALETIERCGGLQAKLIEDLLDVSRVVTGRMRLDLRLVDLSAVIREAVETVRPTADAKGVHLRVRLDPAAAPIAGDTDRLQQIAWNLLSNAVKFTTAGGVVDVELVGTAREVRLTVRDTGRGIAPGFLPFVFDRFRQAEHAISRRSGGLGLGLAIVRHLVELHGGTVAAASAGDGTGATFTATFPSTAVQVAHADDREPPLPDATGSH